jgi:hypothetical protein
MKDPINSRVTDARFEIVKIRTFSVILEAVILFTLCAVAFSLTGVNITLGFMPAFAYFMLKFAVIVRDRRTISSIVLKYPALDERLQTAYDNRKESNVLVERLILDVSKRLDDLHSSAFMSGKGVFVRVFVIVILMFALLSIHLVEIQQAGLHFRTDMEKTINDLTNGGEDVTGSGHMSSGNDKEYNQSQYGNKKETEKVGGGPGGKAPGFSEGPLGGQGGGTGENDNPNLYGAPTSARIEGQNVKMEVHPEYGGEVDIEDTRKPSDTRPFSGVDTVDTAASDRSQDPVEYEEVIRNYFQKLSDEGAK